jgi:EAL domain-containing protein (putative c-di-GMP-specific phosphodiesterase class I)
VNRFLFVFQIEDPTWIEDVFGGGLLDEVYRDLTRGFREIAYRVLGRQAIISDVMSPAFGLWSIAYSPGELEFPSESGERAETVVTAGKQLIREMLQENLGMATGTEIDFKAAVIPLPEACRDRAAFDAHIRDSLEHHAPVGRPRGDVSRADFTQIVRSRNIATYLQPIVELPGGKIVGYESLSRCPERNSIQTADYLFGTATHFGLREELEMACMSRALESIAQIPDPLWLSINLSPDLITAPRLRDLMNAPHLRGRLHRIMIEITEHIPVPKAGEMLKAIHDLEGRGVRFALDDTGCGFADIGTVEILRPRIVKLCITVIRRIRRQPHMQRDIRSIVERVRKLGGEVLGEGVERVEEVEILKASGVRYAQGFYFGRPRPAEVVLRDLSPALGRTSP